MDCVYVGNLPPDIRIKDIDDFFKPFGKLVYIDVNHRANPVHAYVQFESDRNAFNAVRSRHGYDYEGYTLQLQLRENGVRKRRDASPPPPPPRMLNSYGRPIDNVGFNNYGGSSSLMSGGNNNYGGNNQLSGGNNYGSSNNQLGVANNYGSSLMTGVNNNYGNSNNQMSRGSNNYGSSSNQMNSNFSSSTLLEANSFWSNTNRTDVQQNMVQYPTTSRLNIARQNMNGYSASSRSNIQPLSMVTYPLSGSGNNQQRHKAEAIMPATYSRNNVNDRGNYNNDRSNGNMNINDRYGDSGYDDSYTRGLSGSGRKWFNRYIQQGFTKERARKKALEHRTVPYLRDDYPKKNSIPNDSTNAALETIGNTIISLLATNQVDNYNKVGGGNYEMSGPSSSTSGNRSSSQIPRNAVSRKQYFKSLRILGEIRKRDPSAKDRISKKYHTQIVKDYEQFKSILNRASGSKVVSSGSKVVTSGSKVASSGSKVVSAPSEDKLSEMLREKKGELFKAARTMGATEQTRRMFGGAQKKRYRVLTLAGFSVLEAEVLSILTIESLKPLLSIKEEYDMATKKTDFISGGKINSDIPKNVVYRNDIKYLNQYKKERVTNLSRRIKIALCECIIRMNNYEKENNLPLTKNHFCTVLQSDSSLRKPKRKKSENEKSSTSNAKKDNAINKNQATATTTTKEQIQEENNKDTKDVEIVEEKNMDKEHDVIEINDEDENMDNQDITDDQQDGNNEQEFEDNEHENEDADADAEDKDQNEKDLEDPDNSANADDDNENDDIAD